MVPERLGEEAQMSRGYENCSLARQMLYHFRMKCMAVGALPGVIATIFTLWGLPVIVAGVAAGYHLAEPIGVKLSVLPMKVHVYPFEEPW